MSDGARRQVDHGLAGLGDKRQITVLLAVAMDSTMLAPQIIYARKSDRCLPRGLRFPDDWDIAFTENHWSNEQSMLRYVKNVIIPRLIASSQV